MSFVKMISTHRSFTDHISQCMLAGWMDYVSVPMYSFPGGVMADDIDESLIQGLRLWVYAAKIIVMVDLKFLYPAISTG